jgi:glucan 1,3-beta-glucosidase
MCTSQTNGGRLLPLLIVILPFFPLTTCGHDGGTISPAIMATGAQAPFSMPSCTGPVVGVPVGFWLDQQDHTGTARGYAPFIDNYFTYPTYRNALKYGARNDGSGDQTSSLQAALNDDGRGGNRYNHDTPITTFEPAEVFLPGGTYQLQKTLDLRMGTIIVGDPLDPPVIRAAADFNGDTVVNGYDSATGHPEDSFMTLLKNVIIDTTSVSADRQLTALQWGVAQGCGLTNVQIRMPSGPTQHTGIFLHGGSTIIVSNVVSVRGRHSVPADSLT